MLRLNIILDVHGRGIILKDIAKAEIWNDATGTKTKGNYKYRLFGEKKIIGEGRIEGYKRLQDSVWYLLYLILKDKFDKLE